MQLESSNSCTQLQRASELTHIPSASQVHRECHYFRFALDDMCINTTACCIKQRRQGAVACHQSWNVAVWSSLSCIPCGIWNAREGVLPSLACKEQLWGESLCITCCSRQQRGQCKWKGRMQPRRNVGTTDPSKNFLRFIDQVTSGLVLDEQASLCLWVLGRQISYPCSR